MLSHLAALAIFTSIPFGNILGPLLVFLLKGDKDRFVAEQGKESLNFQITITLVGIILLLGYITVFFSYLARAIGHPNVPDGIPWFVLILPVLVMLAVFNVISIIVAAVRTYNGDHFRYPLSLRFVR